MISWWVKVLAPHPVQCTWAKTGTRFYRKLQTNLPCSQRVSKTYCELRAPLLRLPLIAMAQSKKPILCLVFPSAHFHNK